MNKLESYRNKYGTRDWFSNHGISLEKRIEYIEIAEKGVDVGNTEEEAENALAYYKHLQNPKYE